MNWLLIRGLIREQRHWEHFPAVLEQQFSGSKVHFLDLPGMGTEAGRKSPDSVPAIVEDLRARWLIQKSLSSGPWRVIALSFGGMVMLEWVRRYPEDFESLVLINSSVSNLSPFYERMRLGSAVRFAPLFIFDSPEIRERTLLEQTTSGRTPIADIERRWASFALPRKKVIPVALAQIKAAMKYKLYERLKTPVYVLTSKNDQLASTRCSEKISQFLDVPLRSHEWAGHDLTLEDPMWVCDRMKEFS